MVPEQYFILIIGWSIIIRIKCEILTPGGHPGVIEKNIKFAMAGHNSVHSPRFEDDGHLGDVFDDDNDPDTNLRRDAGLVVSSAMAGGCPCLSRSFTKSADLSGLLQLAITLRILIAFRF